MFPATGANMEGHSSGKGMFAWAYRRPSARAKAPPANGIDVWLHVYDLGAFSKYFMNSWLPSQGAYHVGIEVLGVEWCFQGRVQTAAEKEKDLSGINFHLPKSHPRHHYRESVWLGKSPWQRNDVRRFFMELDRDWTVSSYHFLRRNCVDFAEYVHRKLETPVPFPAWCRGCSKGWLQMTPLAATRMISPAIFNSVASVSSVSSVSASAGGPDQTAVDFPGPRGDVEPPRLQAEKADSEASTSASSTDSGEAGTGARTVWQRIWTSRGAGLSPAPPGAPGTGCAEESSPDAVPESSGGDGDSPAWKAWKRKVDSWRSRSYFFALILAPPRGASSSRTLQPYARRRHYSGCKICFWAAVLLCRSIPSWWRGARRRAPADAGSDVPAAVA